MLYLAYGSNLNIKQMKIRCPYAKPSGTFYMPNYRLVFRRVADITKSEGAKVPIGVWKITKQCEIALDRYEGYPTLYRKEYISLKQNDKRVTAMFYIMNDESYEYMPSISYLKTIEQGYKDFKLNLEYLNNAEKNSRKHSDDYFNELFPSYRR